MTACQECLLDCCVDVWFVCMIMNDSYAAEERGRWLYLRNTFFVMHSTATRLCNTDILCGLPFR